MTLTQIRFARAVAREKSFSAAATACNVSQPSLSNAIANLESELGGPLFARTTRRVNLTPLGEKLAPLLEDVEESVRNLEEAAKAARNASVKLIRMGLSPLVSTPLLALALRPFEARNPSVKVVLKQCFLEDLRDRIGGHALDAAIVPSGFFGRDWERCPFYSDTLQYLASENSPQTGVAAGSVTPRQIAGDTFVLTGDGCGLTPFVRALFQKQRIRIREYPGQALNHQVIEEWVALGLGSGLLPLRKLTSQKPRARPVVTPNGMPVEVSYELAWRKRSDCGPHVTALIRHFRDVVPKLIAGAV
ncbi:MAG: LysR family transcriptional regulator [Bryobacteraceae bacterium]